MGFWYSLQRTRTTPSPAGDFNYMARTTLNLIYASISSKLCILSSFSSLYWPLASWELWEWQLFYPMDSITSKDLVAFPKRGGVGGVYGGESRISLYIDLEKFIYLICISVFSNRTIISNLPLQQPVKDCFSNFKMPWQLEIGKWEIGLPRLRVHV